MRVTVSEAERDGILAAMAKYRAALDRIVVEADSLSPSRDERRSAATIRDAVAYTASTFYKWTDAIHADGLCRATVRGTDWPILLAALVLYGGGDACRGLLRRLFGVNYVR